MGVLFGFTGIPDQKICSRMSEPLRHRGQGKYIFSEHLSGTLAWQSGFTETECESLGCGIYEERDQAIALAGYLTDPPAKENILSHLLIEYKKHGIDFIKNLHGAFVIAVRDKDKLVLARDSAGMRTIYYGSYAGRFFFAIEPKGILAVNGFPRRLRPGAVAQFLTFSFTPESSTMLEDLFELPQEVIDRPKSGMRVPVHYWFKGELQKYARHILSPQKLSAAGIFDPDRVKQLLDYNTTECPGRYGLRLWMIITFEIWRRIVIEGEDV